MYAVQCVAPYYHIVLEAYHDLITTKFHILQLVTCWRRSNNLIICTSYARFRASLKLNQSVHTHLAFIKDAYFPFRLTVFQPLLGAGIMFLPVLQHTHTHTHWWTKCPSIKRNTRDTELMLGPSLYNVVSRNELSDSCISLLSLLAHLCLIRSIFVAQQYNTDSADNMLETGT